ncbi:MAG: hypothetical protein K2K14_07495 [Ruminococcus sp.]|nr:hypothetical protein [Ruminococcus sp.]
MNFNNNRKPDPVSTLISRIILSVIVVPIIYYLNDIPILVGIIVSAVMIVYFIYAFLREKKSDKKSEKIKADFTDGTYFDSTEWREKYLNYVQNYQFEKISPKGMKADLQKRYRKMVSVIIVIFGIFMTFGTSCVWLTDEPHKILMTILGILVGLFICYIGGIKNFSPEPIKKLCYGNYDFNAIENSYNNGKMMSHKKNGINIGHDYTLIYNEKNIYLIDNIDIQNVSRHIVRVKNYVNDIFDSDEYQHKLCIRADNCEYFVELNEYQVEIAIDELSRV